MKIGTFRLTALLTVLYLAASGLHGQTAVKKKTTTKAAAATVTAEDIQALREAIAAQQQQINQLRQDLAARDEALRQSQAAAQQAQTAADQASQKAAAAEQAANQQNTGLDQIKTDIADVKLNQQNAALSSQDDQKRMVAAEGLLGRFRLSGDLRVRGEAFDQSYSGCGAACNNRYRGRIRARLGIDGKLNEDFIGGLYLASGAVVNGAPDLKDPVSTNETLTSFYERKTIGIDRAFITYNPVKHKWLQLTGGKFAYTWNRTSGTFDSDLNPEGFVAKTSWDLSHAGIVKNISLQGMTLLYNEVGAGTDSNAVGGSFSSRLALTKWLTFTPTYTVLNWNGSDAIAQAASPVPLPNPNTPAVGTPLPNPTTQPVRVINANAFTNASAIVGTGTGQRRVFVSDFMYSDFIGDFAIKTPWAKWPARFIGEYEKNLRARRNPVDGYKGDEMFYIEGSIGRQSQKGDLQVGYSYADVDRDAVISQFNESDMRAPTNVIQNRVYVNYLLAQNVTAALTWWIGHTKEVGLQNAAKAPGLPSGMQDPWLNRIQLDLIYKF